MIKKITGFFSEVKQELAKVSWSSRQEIMGATTVVITLTVIMAVFIGIADIVLAKLLSMVFK